MKKKTDIWQSFTDMGDYLKGAAGEISKATLTRKGCCELSQRIEALRQKAQEDRFSLSTRLRREFITPMEREDMYALWEGGFRLLEELAQTAALLYFCQNQTEEGVAEEKGDSSDFKELLESMGECCELYGGILQRMRESERDSLWQLLSVAGRQLAQGRQMYWQQVMRKTELAKRKAGESSKFWSYTIQMQLLHQMQAWMFCCGNTIGLTKLILLKNT